MEDNFKNRKEVTHRNEKENSNRKYETFKKYEELQFSDDFMFWKVMTEYEDICRKVIELCIQKKVRRIRYKGGQEFMQAAPESRGVRLDVYLEDDDRTVYDLEMQTEKRPFLGKRIRYYESVMDINSLQKGMDYEDLPDSYVIFLCLFDPFDKGRVVYEFQSREKKDAELSLGDGATEILINATGNTDECSEEMRQLLSAVKGNTNTEEGGIGQEIADAVREIREHSQWRTEYMLYELNMRDMKLEGREEGLKEGLQKGREEGLIQGRAEGHAEGRNEMAMEIAKVMIAEDMPNEKIAKCCGLSLQEVQDLRNTFQG